MTNTRSLQLELSNNHSSIKSLTIHYPDDTVIGFVSKLTAIPFKVVLTKSVVPRGDNSVHYIDFDKATGVSVLYHDGSSKEFN